MQNRFRVFDWERNVVFRHAELIQVVDFLRKEDLGLNSFYIEDTQDDIEVHSDDLISYFDSGEITYDLQCF